MNNRILLLYKKIVSSSFKNEKRTSFLKQNVIELNQILATEELDFYEKGWVYWQLLDHYALLRDYHNELETLKAFVKFIKDYDESYLWWAVCDATQALTLRLGNNPSYRDEMYHYSIKNLKISKANLMIVFECVRAHIYIPTAKQDIVIASDKDIENGLSMIKQMLDDYPNHIAIKYMTLNYYALLIQYRIYKHQDIEDILLKLEKLDYFKSNNSKMIISRYNDKLLFGSWEGINTPPSEDQSIKIGVNNIKCSLARKKKRISYET